MANSYRRLNVGGADLDEYLIRHAHAAPDAAHTHTRSLLFEKGYRFNALRRFDLFVARDIKVRRR